MLLNQTETTAHNMMAILMANVRHSEHLDKRNHGLTCANCQAVPKQKIRQAIQTQQPLMLILPAFPAKSANRLKTISAQPDLAEVMALRNLNALCQRLHCLHPPGIRLLICSDGRVFNDLVFVSDDEVSVYQQGIERILAEESLTYLSTWSLENEYTGLEEPAMRARLMLEYGESLERMQRRLQMDKAFLYQFNGIHRFMTEDLLFLKPEQSKNKVRNEAKKITYEVIRRSNAWSNLLASRFPLGLRLSIHPQPCGSEKLGIQFLAAGNRWATPWHNVLLKNQQGWQLIKRADAERLGARLQHDHYVLEAC
ncbi:L-tyrosine/L-tryptophan isonitrile synthase family protein [Legionella sp. CNM-4043-24]|uniref:L-tyrosine/L-tryptophan isonitrile synthase family protein n=1 Tax=Legionella sp. CNM-4043-24 TaxID=3421646 RepID=UPI00403A9F1E